MSYVGLPIYHYGTFGEKVMISAREEMKRNPWIEGPRIASKLETIDGVIESLEHSIELAGRSGYEELVFRGGLYLAVMEAGREGVRRYLQGLPPRPLPMLWRR